MNTVEQVQFWMTGDGAEWGVFNERGDRAVNSALQYAARNLLELAKNEAEESPSRHPSLGKRVVIVEDAVTMYRDVNIHFYLSDLRDPAEPDTSDQNQIDVCDQVSFYLTKVLAASGVEELLASAIVDTLPIYND